MFDYLCLKLSNFNQEKKSLMLEIKSPADKLTDTEETLALKNINVTNLSLINTDLHTKKDIIELHEIKLHGITDSWAHSHHKLNKIIDA